MQQWEWVITIQDLENEQLRKNRINTKTELILTAG